MTAQDLVNAGFPVSLHIDSAIITRAATDVRAAYVTPIVGTMADNATITDALNNLTFLLLMQRNVFATRAGGKTKSTLQSQEADTWQTLQEQAHTCHMKIEALRALEGATADAAVQDICKIYFKTNFFNS